MRKILTIQPLLSLLLVVAVASFSAFTHLSSLKEQSGVPFGYFDTAASGAIKAKQDLAKGEVKYAIYGMPMRSYVDKLVSEGVTPLIMGCLAGRAVTEFWMGYNVQIESKSRC